MCGAGGRPVTGSADDRGRENGIAEHDRLCASARTEGRRDRVGSEVCQRQEPRRPAAAAAGFERLERRAPSDPEAIFARQFAGDALGPVRLQDSQSSTRLSSKTWPGWPGGWRAVRRQRRPPPMGCSPCAACSKCPRPQSEEARADRTPRSWMRSTTALAGLEQARSAEGAALGALLLGHLDASRQLTGRAEADPSRDPARSASASPSRSGC